MAHGSAPVNEYWAVQHASTIKNRSRRTGLLEGIELQPIRRVPPGEAGKGTRRYPTVQTTPFGGTGRSNTGRVPATLTPAPPDTDRPDQRAPDATKSWRQSH